MGRITTKKIKYKLTNNLKKHVIRPFAIKKVYDIYNNHYIFADPRGGSTWLMEIIQTITKEPVIWEPLDLSLTNNPFNTINFDWRQYIPSDVNWPEAKQIFELLFRGEVLEKNVLDYSTFSQLQNSKSLLFKFCRGSGLLPWLVEYFTFNYKPIYMVRHPFAVSSSQIRHGAWKHLHKNFEIPETSFNFLYKKNKIFLKSLNSIEEILVAKWCLHNVNTLKHQNNNKKWITLTYEDFVSNPKTQIQRILKEWDTDYNISKLDFNKYSATTHQDSPKSNFKKISNWEEYFTKDQIKKMDKVLEYFGVKIYSGDSSFPKLKI